MVRDDPRKLQEDVLRATASQKSYQLEKFEKSKITSNPSHLTSKNVENYVKNDDKLKFSNHVMQNLS